MSLESKEYTDFLQEKHNEYLKVKDIVDPAHVAYLLKKKKGFFSSIKGHRIKPSPQDIEACYIIADRRKKELSEIMKIKEINDKRILANTPSELVEQYNKAKEVIPNGEPVSIRIFLKNLGYGWDHKFVASIMTNQGNHSIDFLSPKQYIILNNLTQKIFGRNFEEIIWEN